MLACTACRRPVERCAFCERPDCPAGICYLCLTVQLGQYLSQPHAHGG